MKKFVCLVMSIAVLITVWAGATYTISENEATNEKEVANTVEAKTISNDEPSTVVTNDDPEAIEYIESEEVEDSEPEYVEYTIVAGDSLWAIAKEYYNDGNMYTKIATDNGIKSGDIIHPGDIIKIYPEDMTATNVQYDSAPVEDIEEPKTVEVTNNSSFDGDMSVEEAVAILRDVPSTDTSGMEYLGTYRITGYDPHCAHCCGKTNGITASGRQAEFGITAGCNSLPLGTEVYIEGYGFYRIDDVGGMSTNVIDIAAPSHEACYTLTNNSVNVWLVS